MWKTEIYQGIFVSFSSNIPEEKTDLKLFPLLFPKAAKGLVVFFARLWMSTLSCHNFSHMLWGAQISLFALLHNISPLTSYATQWVSHHNRKQQLITYQWHIVDISSHFKLSFSLLLLVQQSRKSRKMSKNLPTLATKNWKDRVGKLLSPIDTWCCVAVVGRSLSEFLAHKAQAYVRLLFIGILLHTVYARVLYLFVCRSSC